MSEMLTTGEAAKLLGCHPITVGRLAEAGKLKYWIINSLGWKLFDTKEVLRLAKEREELREKIPA